MSETGVYKAITAVALELAKTGIGKNRNNQQQGYKFRGIDDVYNELAPLLAKNALCILPRILSRECVERVTAKGGTLFYVIVDAEFDFISAEDGSKHTVKTFGEAMDSADKATNKAMSAAYKYAAFQAFCIPTEGDNDADSTTHEVKTATKKEASQKTEQQANNTQNKKEPATQDQLAKITEICMALSDKTGKTVDEVLKGVSTFPGSSGAVWLEIATMHQKCSKGWASRVIGDGKKLLEEQTKSI